VDEGLVQSLLDRVERYRRTRDVGLLLDPIALADARRVLDDCRPPRADLDVLALAAVADLHWHRYLLLPSPDDEPELSQSLPLFAEVLAARADLVPDVVRRLLIQDSNQPSAGCPSENDPKARALSGATGGLRHSEDVDKWELDNARNRALRTLTILDRLEQSDAAASDVDDAIELLLRELTEPAADGPETAGHLTNLGLLLRHRFTVRGDMEDLDKAVTLLRRPLDLSSGESERAARMSNLGLVLRDRFSRCGLQPDLDEALALFRGAVELTGLDHPDLPGRLSNLALASRDKYTHLAQSEHLDDAIDLQRRALALSPHQSRDRPRLLSNLGVLLRDRFHNRRDPSDLDFAVRALVEAVQLTEVAAPERAGRLSNLALALSSRFDHSGDPSALDEADECWRIATALMTASPWSRARAGRTWGFAMADAGRWDDALVGYAIAVSALTELAWIGLARRTRQRQLAQWQEVAADAAACAIRAGRADMAVELLEQGRTVLWSQDRQRRNGGSQLATEAPNLHHRLDSVSRALDEIDDLGSEADQELTIEGPSPAWHGGSERRRAAAEWDSVVAQVRELPGFERFLAPVSFDDLRQLTVKGPVVILNTSRFGCHALIVTMAELKVIALDPNTYEDALTYANRMLALTAGHYPVERSDPRHEELFAILEWLWVTVASPVLGILSSLIPDLGQRVAKPRVWWCPTGPLSFLPIHAAGCYGAATGGREIVSNFVVSSYIASLGSLTQTASATNPTKSVSRLAVGVPNPQGFPQLPEVLTELEALRRISPSPFTMLVDSEATRGTVRQALSDHSLIHFSCHGHVDSNDPFDSGLVMSDGILKASDLANSQIGTGQLVVLAACSTARADTVLTQESLSLSSALLSAGVGQVVATLWPVLDVSSARMTERFYARLAQQQHALDAATALADATEAMRTLYPDNPFLWAPYIHLGS
jgi:tetratricopeptide (TPR) repeat protein